jgi:F0F1-type ATP synthase assembly protein I
MSEKTSSSRLIRHTSAGIQFIGLFLLMLGGGYWLDCHQGTGPGFTAIGGVLGFFASLYRLYRQGHAVMEEGESDRADTGGPPKPP